MIRVGDDFPEVNEGIGYQALDPATGQTLSGVPLPAVDGSTPASPARHTVTMALTDDELDHLHRVVTSLTAGQLAAGSALRTAGDLAAAAAALGLGGATGRSGSFGFLDGLDPGGSDWTWLAPGGGGGAEAGSLIGEDEYGLGLGPDTYGADPGSSVGDSPFGNFRQGDPDNPVDNGDNGNTPQFQSMIRELAYTPSRLVETAENLDAPNEGSTASAPTFSDTATNIGNTDGVPTQPPQPDRPEETSVPIPETPFSVTVDDHGRPTGFTISSPAVTFEPAEGTGPADGRTLPLRGGRIALGRVDAGRAGGLARHLDITRQPSAGGTDAVGGGGAPHWDLGFGDRERPQYPMLGRHPGLHFVNGVPVWGRPAGRPRRSPDPRATPLRVGVAGADAALRGIARSAGPTSSVSASIATGQSAALGKLLGALQPAVAASQAARLLGVQSR